NGHELLNRVHARIVRYGGAPGRAAHLSHSMYDLMKQYFIFADPRTTRISGGEGGLNVARPPHCRCKINYNVAPSTVTDQSPDLLALIRSATLQDRLALWRRFRPVRRASRCIKIGL